MTDLITLDCYKEAKSLTSTTRDGKIQALITQVTELIEHYCNRRFTAYTAADRVEWFDAKVNVIELTEFPLISVTTVKVSKDGGVTQTTLTEAAVGKDGYFVDIEDGLVSTQKTSTKFLTTYDTPFRSLEVAYSAGYTEDTLPADLKLCTIDLVHYYEKEENIPSKTMLGATLDNPQPYIANSFPPSIRRVLDLYRFSA